MASVLFLFSLCCLLVVVLAEWPKEVVLEMAVIKSTHAVGECFQHTKDWINHARTRGSANLKQTFLDTELDVVCCESNDFRFSGLVCAVMTEDVLGEKFRNARLLHTLIGNTPIFIDSNGVLSEGFARML